MFPNNPLDASGEQLGDAAQRWGSMLGSAAYVATMDDVPDDLPHEERVTYMVNRLMDPKAGGLGVGAKLVQGVKVGGVDVGKLAAGQGLALVTFYAKDEERFGQFVPPYLYASVPTPIWKEWATHVLSAYKQVCIGMGELMQQANEAAAAALSGEVDLDDAVEMVASDTATVGETPSGDGN